MRRIMIDDLRINDMNLKVVGTLKLHNSDGFGNFTPLGESTIIVSLSGNGSGLRIIPSATSAQSIPELTDEEHNLIRSMMDAYVAAIMHRKSFCAWTRVGMIPVSGPLTITTN